MYLTFPTTQKATSNMGRQIFILDHRQFGLLQGGGNRLVGIFQQYGIERFHQLGCGGRIQFGVRNYYPMFIYQHSLASILRNQLNWKDF